MDLVKIVEYSFNEIGQNQINNEDKGRDWPVVYLIYNDEQLYVGETQNMSIRFSQHKKNPDRKTLTAIKVIFDDEFNKSAILDIEQSLIQLFTADGKYTLQNYNGGQSEKHNYYQREKYLNKIDEIWFKLSQYGMTNNKIDFLRNQDIFKYSPYNTLTTEQNEVCHDIIQDIIEKFSNNEKGISIINGGAGTGKTVVLINMIYRIINAEKIDIDFSKENEELNENMQLIHQLKVFRNEFKKKHNRDIKIGYVVPMTSIRATLSKVFNQTKNGLTGDMVIGPLDVFKVDYDILFVDEAHRLAQYKNIGFMGKYKKAALKMHKDPKEITQLDMILAKAQYQVLVYDQNQTVKGSDITHEQFMRSIGNQYHQYHLTTQMRCKGGETYTKYVSNILSCIQNERLEMDNYDLKLYEDVNDMVQTIKEYDKKYSLCRNAAGYSWKWISQNIKSYENIIAQGKEDIHIGPYKYVWNMTNHEFIISENSINEIGCIHTLQGYDLNYIGLIFGREIDYNPVTNDLEINLDLFFDTNVKKGSDYDTVKNYIINSYKVMMTRGIKGCFIYAYNTNLRNYLSQFMQVEKHLS